jgi:hypothetical protein
VLYFKSVFGERFKSNISQTGVPKPFGSQTIISYNIPHNAGGRIIKTRYYQ